MDAQAAAALLNLAEKAGARLRGSDAKVTLEQLEQRYALVRRFSEIAATLHRLTPACSPEENPPMELDADDVLIGRVLTRREVLVLFGTAGTGAALAACAPGATATGAPGATATGTPGASAAATASAGASGTAAVPACIVRPALTEGPYFVDERLLRSDIRSDPSGAAEREGLPLEIAFAVSQIRGSQCTALANALVDVWHYDAAGQYSDVQDQGFDTTGQKWLRGYQVTDEAGNATFLTIYPGWYQGRKVHIHSARPGCERRPRIHLAALLRRRDVGPGLRERAVCGQG